MKKYRMRNEKRSTRLYMGSIIWICRLLQWSDRDRRESWALEACLVRIDMRFCQKNVRLSYGALAEHSQKLSPTRMRTSSSEACNFSVCRSRTWIICKVVCQKSDKVSSAQCHHEVEWEHNIGTTFRTLNNNRDICRSVLHWSILAISLERLRNKVNLPLAQVWRTSSTWYKTLLIAYVSLADRNIVEAHIRF